MSKHFPPTELTFSSTAQRLGLVNTPPAAIAAVLADTADRMEQVREQLGYPIHIDSGYRCPELNRAVGGAGNSAHMAGTAVDFTCTAFGTPLEIVKAIAASAIKFDQLIQEGAWVHISFAPAMRRQILTAHFVAGRTTYTYGA